MPQILPLPAGKLHASHAPDRLPWKDSTEIPLARINRTGSVFQPRAMRALELALSIHHPGYHVYLSGERDLGRSHMLLSYLKPIAARASTPPDLVFARNFSDPDRPRLLALPVGQGQKLKSQTSCLIDSIRADLNQRLDTLNFARKRASLADKYENFRFNLLQKMNGMASGKGFALEMGENGGIELYPVLKGKKLHEEDLAKLDVATRMELKRKGDLLANNMMGFMRELDKAETTFHADEHNLEIRAMEQTLNAIFAPFEQRILKSCDVNGMREYLAELRKDILKNTEAFLPHDSESKGEEQHIPSGAENFFNRYAINILVDNSTQTGAPIIFESNPTPQNLLGCVERESEMGLLVTDLTLIRAGSLHRANGGYLILHVDDIMRHPMAWEGLARALRSSQALIEDGGDTREGVALVKGLRPEPIDLNLKVVLIGGEEAYEYLLENEESFSKLFRIKAHMTDTTIRTSANIRHYLVQIGQIIHEANLPVFDASALAWLVDLGSRLCSDQRRLSLKFPVLRDVMIESAALAAIQGQSHVNAGIMEEAYCDREYRANLLEEELMEEYGREMIKVPTSGQAIGQVNGLAVTWTGDFEFGLPHRISCTVGVGHDGIMDLEREADLGGPIHTKAMMILKSYLTDLFARKKPIILSASLYFEQSYDGIEGDSASGAELAALLSALAEVPVRLDLAFTGAVGNTGQIMAVGGVSRKIEGFYKVCARRGLTGTQGVIIPADNVDQLMLSPTILASVEKGDFAVYSVRNIEEALFLLTGMRAGHRRKNGTFTPGTLYDLVDRRLEQLGCHAQNAFRRSRKD